MFIFDISNARPRLKASGVHLFISVLIITAVGVLVMGMWFPKPYRELSGGVNLWLLIAGVDLVLGPLLTFLVFNTKKSKRELVMDLSIIACMQLAAMAYGLWVIAQARPVFLVHEVDRFKIVTRADVDDDELQRAAPAFRELSLWGSIPTVGVRPAKDGNERLKDIDSALQGVDVSMMPQRWQALSEENKAQIRQLAKPVSELDKLLTRPEDHKSLADAVTAAGLTKADLVAFPIVGRHFMTWTALLENKTLAIKSYAPIDWFEVLAPSKVAPKKSPS